MNWETIETQRLLLRGFEASDIQFVYKQFSDDYICKYLYDDEPLSSSDEAKKLIELFSSDTSKTITRWVIVDKESKERIGTCGYHCFDKQNNSIEIGYDLMKEQCQKGIMTEALTSIINHAFLKKGINRIQAFVATDNIASFKLLEKIGFTREGIIRDKHLFRGNFYDHFCYSLLKREWIEKGYSDQSL